MPEIIRNVGAPKKSNRLAAGCAAVGCSTVSFGTVGLAALLAAVKLGVFATNEQIIPEAAPVADAADDAAAVPSTEAIPAAPVVPADPVLPAAPVPAVPAPEAPVAPATPTVVPATPAAEPVKNTALPKGWELAPDIFDKGTDAQKADRVKAEGSCAAYTFICEDGTFKAGSASFTFLDGCPTPGIDWTGWTSGTPVTVTAKGDGVYDKAMTAPADLCPQVPGINDRVIHYLKTAK